MMNKPDYSKNIVNVVSSILKYFGCEVQHSEFPLEGNFEGFFKIVVKSSSF